MQGSGSSCWFYYSFEVGNHGTWKMGQATSHIVLESRIMDSEERKKSKKRRKINLDE